MPTKIHVVTLPSKVRLVKAMVFPVVMYGCESWTIKKAEHQRIDVFELWCWRRLLRVPWTARRSNQSILKEISPGCSLEGLMLKLKLQYFGHLMRRADSFEKTLLLGKIEGRRRRGRQRMRWLDGVGKSRTQLSDWTELNWMDMKWYHFVVFICISQSGCLNYRIYFKCFSRGHSPDNLNGPEHTAWNILQKGFQICKSSHTPHTLCMKAWYFVPRFLI